MTYQASFGSSFDVTPQVGLAWTGIGHDSVIGNVLFGWEAAVSAITLGGATFTVTPFYNLTILKMIYMACQGDRLQVFLLDYQSTDVNAATINIPFDYTTKVNFDPLNPPVDVFVGIFVAGVKQTSDSDYVMFAVQPASWNGASYVSNLGVQPYSGLYGAAATFVNTGDVVIYQLLYVQTTAQLTLILQRTNLAAEAPTTGHYFSEGNIPVDGTLVVDVSGPNNAIGSVGAAQFLVAIVGMSDFWIQGQNGPACSASINYTSATVVNVKSSTYVANFPSFAVLFYVFQCPAGCTTCNSDSVCLTCSQHSYRIAAPDSSNQCPCFKGFYENASGNCVICPASSYCGSCGLFEGNVVCLTCNCANHREKEGNACLCKTGYQENAGTPGPYCEKIQAT